MEELTGRTKPLTRIWDRDFNLVAAGEDVDAVIGQLIVTVDDVDGRPRKSGRISTADITWMS